jgi:hypothetical protein
MAPATSAFFFGIDAMPNLIALAEELPDSAYSVPERPQAAIKTTPRQRPERHKERIVRARSFKTIHTLEERVAEFDDRLRPGLPGGGAPQAARNRRGAVASL